MGINRRSFFKTMGVVGGTLTLGKSFAAPARDEKSVSEFYGILYDSTLCGGCQGCEYACAEAYGFDYPDIEDVPELGVKREPDETRRITINAFETSKGEQ